MRRSLQIKTAGQRDKEKKTSSVLLGFFSVIARSRDRKQEREDGKFVGG